MIARWVGGKEGIKNCRDNATRRSANIIEEIERFTFRRCTAALEATDFTFRNTGRQDSKDLVQYNSEKPKTIIKNVSEEECSGIWVPLASTSDSLEMASRPDARSSNIKQHATKRPIFLPRGSWRLARRQQRGQISGLSSTQDSNSATFKTAGGVGR